MFKEYGVFGFYCGFIVFLMVEGFWSVIWWVFYSLYLDVIGKMVFDGTLYFVIKGLLGMIVGISLVVVGNLLDIIRVRL